MVPNTALTVEAPSISVPQGRSRVKSDRLPWNHPRVLRRTLDQAFVHTLGVVVVASVAYCSVGFVGSVFGFVSRAQAKVAAEQLTLASTEKERMSLTVASLDGQLEKWSVVNNYVDPQRLPLSSGISGKNASKKETATH